MPRRGKRGNFICGCYNIINKTTGKVYVGISIHIKERWSIHRQYLRKNKHPNNHLQNAWNKYGENDFEFNMLEVIDFDYNNKDINYRKAISEKLDKLEKKYFTKYNSTEREYGYNLNEAGLHGVASEETKKKLSEMRQGENNSFYGKKHSKDSKKLMGGAVIDYSGEKNPNYGNRWSDEQKEQMSKINKGRNLGKHHNNETKQKISKSNSGSKNGMAKKFKLVSPNGEEYIIFGGIAQKLKEFGLCYSSFKIKNNIKQSKGWYLYVI